MMHDAQRGGAPMLGKYIMNKFKAMGYNVFILLLEPGKMLNELPEIGYVRLIKGESDLSKFLNDISNINIEKVFCNSALTGLYTKLFKLKGYHVVSLIHEMSNLIKKRREFGSLATMLQYSDSILFPSSVVRNDILSLFNDSSSLCNQIEIRPQGLFLTTIREINKKLAKQKIAAEYNFDVTKALVINVATAIHRKGFDLFVQAAKQDPGRIYLWVGYTANSYTKQCLDTIGGKPANFISVGYLSNPRELEHYYEAADALALTSREEPFGSIVLEAFSFATPVVAFEGCGGYVDVVKTGETGALAPEVCADSLVSTIDMLFNKYNADAISSNCRKIASKMSFDEYVEHLLKM